MSDAQHAPGPWVVHPQTSERGIPVRDADGGAVAQFWGCDDEAQSNARLGAAAPDLLEALNYAASMLVSTIGADHPALSVVLAPINASIRKATGGGAA